MVKSTRVNKTKKSAKKILLSEFINENQGLISVVGIFGALSAFFMNLGEDAVYLAGLSFSIFILLCFSTYSKIPKRDDVSVPLHLFEILFWFLTFFLAIFFNKKFQSAFISFLNLALILAFGWAIFEFQKKIKIFKFFKYITHKIKNKTFSNILIFIIMVAIIVIVIKILSPFVKLISSLMLKFPLKFAFLSS